MENKRHISERYYVIVNSFNIDKSLVTLLPPGLKFKLIMLSDGPLDNPTSKIAYEYLDHGTRKLLFNNQIWARYGIPINMLFKQVADSLRTDCYNLTHFCLNRNEYFLIYLVGSGL